MRRNSMLWVKGDPTASEREAAEKLAQIILRSWPHVSDDPTNHIWIIVGAKCYGQKIKDIDLLLLASFETGLPYRPDHAFPQSSQRKLPDEVLVKNMCAAIEVKGHYPEDTRFEGSRVQVYYQDSGWKDAAYQNYQQGIAVKGYIKDNGLKSPWVTNLLWLLNVPEKNLPQCLHNILGSDLTWEHFLDVMILNDEPQIIHQRSKSRPPILASASSYDVIAKAADLFIKPLVPTQSVDHQGQEAEREQSEREPQRHAERAIREERQARATEAEFLRYRKAWGQHNAEEAEQLRKAKEAERLRIRKALRLYWTKKEEQLRKAEEAEQPHIRKVLRLRNAEEEERKEEEEKIPLTNYLRLTEKEERLRRAEEEAERLHKAEEAERQRRAEKEEQLRKAKEGKLSISRAVDLFIEPLVPTKPVDHQGQKAEQPHIRKVLRLRNAEEEGRKEEEENIPLTNYLRLIQKAERLRRAEEAERQRRAEEERKSYLQLESQRRAEIAGRYLANKQYEEALEVLSSAIQLTPNNSSLHSNMGYILIKLRRFYEALDILNTAIRLDPNNSHAFVNQGAALNGLGKFPEALEAFSHAIQLNPNNGNIYRNIGYTLVRLEKFQEALDAFNHAIRFDPNDSPTFVNQGAALSGLGRYQEAIEAYKRAEKIDPSNYQAKSE